MRETQRSEQLANEYMSHSGRRFRRGIARTLRNTAVLGVILAGTQVAHNHPEIVQQIPTAVNEFLRTGANVAYAAVDIAYHAGDIAGNAVNHIVPFSDKLPHLLTNQTVVGNYANEHLLTDVEVGGTLGIINRVRKDRKREMKFKQEASEMSHVSINADEGTRGIQLGSHKDRQTMWGNPAKTADNVLANPQNTWNSARITYSIEHLLTETLAAREGKWTGAINPRAIGLAGGEAAEQVGKIVLDRHLATFLGGLGWAISHFVFTMPEARKTGAPELAKLSWATSLWSPVPGVAGVLGALFTVPLEWRMHKYQEKVYAHLAAGIQETLTTPLQDTRALRGRAKRRAERANENTQFIASLAAKAFQKPEVASAALRLPSTISALATKNSPVVVKYNSLIGNLQRSVDRDIEELQKREHANIFSRMLHGRRIHSLEQQITEKHTDMSKLMHDRFQEAGREVQIARALQAIYNATRTQVK